MQIYAIYGPTGSGKTKYALSISRQNKSALLISVDSRKAYKELNIGTHKSPLTTLEYSPKFFGINLYEPTETFTVTDYRDKVYSFIQSSLKESHQSGIDTIIFFGGSGLFLDSILFGLNHKYGKPNPELRNNLEAESVRVLQNKAIHLNKDLYLKLSASDKLNKRRLIRIIEATHNSQKENTIGINYNYSEIYNLLSESDLRIILPKTDRKELNPKLLGRVEEMLNEGWIEEVRTILSKFDFDMYEDCSISEIKQVLPALGIMGYKSIVEFLQKRLTYKGLKDLLFIEHRQYAKRQYTWAKRYINPYLKYPDRNVTFKDIKLEYAI